MPLKRWLEQAEREMDVIGTLNLELHGLSRVPTAGFAATVIAYDENNNVLGSFDVSARSIERVDDHHLRVNLMGYSTVPPASRMKALEALDAVTPEEAEDA